MREDEICEGRLGPSVRAHLLLLLIFPFARAVVLCWGGGRRRRWEVRVSQSAGAMGEGQESEFGCWQESSEAGSPVSLPLKGTLNPHMT